MTITGNNSESFGLSWPRELTLNGNRTLEIEVVDLGHSAFKSDETKPGSGDGKMLKVFIWKVEGGPDETLKCDNQMALSNDPDFILRGTGTFRYSLNPLNGDNIYKIGFCFYNAVVEGFALKARFVK